MFKIKYQGDFKKKASSYRNCFNILFLRQWSHFLWVIISTCSYLWLSLSRGFIVSDFCMCYTERCQKGRAWLWDREQCVCKGLEMRSAATHIHLLKCFCNYAHSYWSYYELQPFRGCVEPLKMGKPPTALWAKQEGEQPLAWMCNDSQLSPAHRKAPVQRALRACKGLWELQRALAKARKNIRRSLGYLGLGFALPPQKIFI